MEGMACANTLEMLSVSMSARIFRAVYASVNTCAITRAACTWISILLLPRRLLRIDTISLMCSAYSYP